MSTAEPGAEREARGALVTAWSPRNPAAAAAPYQRPAVSWLRLLASEFRLVFRRRRNLALLGVVAVIHVIIGIALRLAAPPTSGGGGQGPPFLDQVAGNGVFLSFLALTIQLTLVLPLVVAVAAGDSVAGEAGYGTLRYLLCVPAGRTRLLGVKYLTVVAFGLVAAGIITSVSLVAGVALFPVGPVTLLSGTSVSLAEGLLRVLFVTLYVAAAMASLGAIGLAISTFTEHAIGAIAALAIIVVASQVGDSVPQFSVVHPYLPTHWWDSFDSLLRSPVDTTTLTRGLLSFGVYIVVFGAIAWARFTSSDVTS
ncbi:MAG TPA: ABC transporter permease [Streptosporangiaceae bacterium]